MKFNLRSGPSAQLSLTRSWLAQNRRNFGLLSDLATGKWVPALLKGEQPPKKGYLRQFSKRHLYSKALQELYSKKSRRSQMDQIIYLGFGSVKRQNGSSNGAVPFTTAKKRKYKYSLCFNVHLHQLGGKGQEEKKKKRNAVYKNK